MSLQASRRCPLLASRRTGRSSGSVSEDTPPEAFEGHVIRLVHNLERKIVGEAFERVVMEREEEVSADKVVLRVGKVVPIQSHDFLDPRRVPNLVDPIGQVLVLRSAPPRLV